MNLNELQAKFVDWMHVRGLSLATRQTYTFRLGKFFLWLGENPWAEVDQVMAVAYRDKLAETYSPATIGLYLTVARRFYTLLFERGLIKVNPFYGVTSPRKNNSSRREAISLLEWQALLRTCDNSHDGVRTRAIFWLAYGLGLRSVEIHRADIDDLRISGDLRVIWVQSKGASTKGDFLVISPEVDRALADWMIVRGDQPGALFPHLSSLTGRIGLGTIRKIWFTHKVLAGISGDLKTFHSLRHSAIDNRARYSVAHGKSPLLVQTFARHKSMSSTMKYIHNVGRLSDPPELWLS
jgi:integrase/recombinase XerC